MNKGFISAKTSSVCSAVRNEVRSYGVGMGGVAGGGVPAALACARAMVCLSEENFGVVGVKPWLLREGVSG